MKSIEYHQTTRHYPNKFAKSLGYLDWANQPSPYKEYINAKKIPLPNPEIEKLTYEKLYLKNSSKEINIQNLAAFLRYSAAINAKKVLGMNEWYVRVNPSSGNLHPEETYIILKNGVYHFNVKEFCLEKIAKGENLVENGFVLIFTSIPLRESWKYGERALRYCLLDTGHLIASSRFSSNMLGWKMEYINDIDEEKLSNLINLNKAKFYENEDEIFEAGFYVYRDKKPKINFENFKNLEFHLEYKKLANDSVKWDIIFETAKELKRKEPFKTFLKDEIPKFISSPFNAYEIIDNRRSALGFIPSYIEKKDFLDILDKTLPRNIPPFDVKVTLNTVDFVIFVNRVDGIEEGIYYFSRKENKLTNLHKGDFSEASKFANCIQDLGKDSTFTINMVSPKPKKEYEYKLLNFEAGIIGEVLYLEAEAKNLRGCGIGCFFDNLITEEILNNVNYLALYGFSVGSPKADERIIKLN
ncbi:MULTISPECIES: SagB/ThcOx family dehydrogenase [unclassified Lebetimonas]|uniref:SagB/ThcOx family dehydrogenase n=1 Tax=unclassified Lebetimonas TaxID=2648158 RepID=UPI0004669826|nr:MULTISPECIES: SagB/ThcOx family dehydrogenase [unclassified Lebetimonas]